MAVDAEELFERHDLVVEFDGELGEDFVASSRVLRTLRQLFDLLGDRSNFQTVVLVVVQSLLLRVRVLASAFFAVEHVNCLATRVNVVKDMRVS